MRAKRFRTRGAARDSRFRLLLALGGAHAGRPLLPEFKVAARFELSRSYPKDRMEEGVKEEGTKGTYFKEILRCDTCLSLNRGYSLQGRLKHADVGVLQERGSSSSQRRVHWRYGRYTQKRTSL